VRCRILIAVLLCAGAFVMPARGQELPGATTPITLPGGFKPLLNRVSVDKSPPATVEDFVKRLAEDNKLKIEFDPAFLKEFPDVAKRKIAILPVRDVRLDILLDGLVRQAGAVPACTVKEGVLVFVKPADAVVTRPNKTQAVQTLLQPPDEGHATAVAALKRKLATKTNVEASTDVPLIEFLVAVSKKHELTFQLKNDLFARAGVPNIAGTKPTIRAAKGATLEAILRDALKSVDADFVIDGYGNVSVVPKAVVPKKSGGCVTGPPCDETRPRFSCYS
jgi:hypothetical protein